MDYVITNASVALLAGSVLSLIAAFGFVYLIWEGKTGDGRHYWNNWGYWAAGCVILSLVLFLASQTIPVPKTHEEKSRDTLEKILP